MSRPALPVIVIVTGPPASGKSTIAERIADALHIPLVSKDGIKEQLFNTLGWYDKGWSERLDDVAYEVLFYYAEMQLRAEQSLVVESNFDHASSQPRFRRLAEKHAYSPLQIECTAPEEELVERFEERLHSGRRHPGHGEQNEDPNEFRTHVENADYGPMDLGGEVLTMDTTGTSEGDYERMLDRVRAAVQRLRQGG